MDTIYDTFRNVAAANPSCPAIIEENRTLSFSDLLELTDRIAALFPEDVQSVGIVMSHQAEFTI